jgi:hypothetical protein
MPLESTAAFVQGNNYKATTRFGVGGAPPANEIAAEAGEEASELCWRIETEGAAACPGILGVGELRDGMG